MIDKIVDTIAAVHGQHEAWQRPDRTWECACGKAYGVKINHDHHVAEHILAALKAQRMVVVELPGRCIPPKEWNGDNIVGAWPGPVGEDPVSAWRTNRYDHDAIAMPGGDFITTEDARALALALLAATDAAEAVES